MISIRDLFKGLYKLCECGCGELIPVLDKRGRPRRFKKGHQPKGINHHNWKGGRKRCGKYWFVLIPDYYSANERGYILEHRYFFEQYHKCCLLPWGEVHHIEPVTNDYCNNMIWNLQGMMKQKHITMHKKGNDHRLGKHKDTSYIKCYNCGTNKTTLKKPFGTLKTPLYEWLHLPWDKVNFYCRNCYLKIMYYDRKKKKVINRSLTRG